MKELLLKLRDICYSYEDSPFALRHVSVEIRRGDRIAVLGSNGAGKSTFFLLCNGVLQPDSGSISYRGAPVNGQRKRELRALRQRVGVVFQDPNQQIVGSTVEGEISFGPHNLRLPLARVEERVEAAMEAMGLGKHRDRAPHYLSGGEKKRVTIADVLAMEPEIILLDEPTASLDHGGVAMLEDNLSALAGKGKTLVVSTHDVDFAWRWADRTLVFHAGRLLMDASPLEVFSSDEVWKRAGLRRPYLYEMALRVKEITAGEGNLWPRTVAELDALFPGRADK